jgi:hypothetical protein
MSAFDVHEILIATRALLADAGRFTLTDADPPAKLDLWSAVHVAYEGRPKKKHATLAATQTRVLGALRRRGYTSLDEFATRGSQAEALAIIDDAIRSTPSILPPGA